jgi:hypothetical protein
MEDSGAWEELQRLNTSSIGIVTSAIQSFVDNNSSFPTQF